MGDLEHFSAKGATLVVQDVTLGILLRIAGEQDRTAIVERPEDQRVVVRIRVRAVVAALGPQDLQRDVAGANDVARTRMSEGHPDRTDRAQEFRVVRGAAAAARVDDQADREPGQHGGQPAT